jgi:RluA family pseudouridine synthase
VAAINLASVPVVYEDENVIILDKPGGILSIEDGFQPDLLNLRSLLTKKYGRIWVVHRLDKDTSGIIIFAKNADSHRFINSQFSERRVIKTYQAVVHGFPLWREKIIELPLKINGDRKHRTIIDSLNGKKALSSVKLIEHWAAYSLFHIVPATGYTHQIRAHCAAYGFPIVGDHQYFRGCEIGVEIKIKKLLLHAYSLEISLSPGQTSHIFSVPPPADFQVFLSGLFSHHK